MLSMLYFIALIFNKFLMYDRYFFLLLFEIPPHPCYREPRGLQGVAITNGRGGTYVHSVNQRLPVGHLENGRSLMLLPAPNGFNMCHLTDLCLRKQLQLKCFKKRLYSHTNLFSSSDANAFNTKLLPLSCSNTFCNFYINEYIC